MQKQSSGGQVAADGPRIVLMGQHVLRENGAAHVAEMRLSKFWNIAQEGLVFHDLLVRKL